MNLKPEESFTGVVLFIGVGVVGAELTIEPDLDVISFATNDKFVPIVPFKELEALLAECLAGSRFLVGF